MAARSAAALQALVPLLQLEQLQGWRVASKSARDKQKCKGGVDAKRSVSFGHSGSDRHRIIAARRSG
jgi:hypothetical protein